MMRLIPLLLLLLLATSCEMRTFDCGVVDIETTRDVVVAEYPDVAGVFDGMDVYCVDDTDTFQACRGEHTEGCTMWLGRGPYRGKMFHDVDEPFVASVLEKAQHWHLMLANGDDGCPTHEAACGWKD